MTWLDTGEVAAFTTADGGAGVQRRARAAAAQVAVAVNAFNFFPKPIITMEPDIVALSRTKTTLFLILMPLVSLVVVLWYMLTPQLQFMSEPFPSYAHYTTVGMADLGASCPCRQQSLNVGDVATITLPSITNTSANFCASVLAMAQACGLSSPTFPASPCVATNPGAMYTMTFAFALKDICSGLQVAITDVVQNLQTASIGPQLLTPTAFSSFMTRSAMLEVQKYTIYIASLVNSMRVPAWALLTAGTFDLAFGTPDSTPTGCNCTTSAVTPGLEPVNFVFTNATCHFRALFDTRPGDEPNTHWSCVGAENFVRFPLDLFTNASWFADVLRLPPPYEPLTNFTLMNSTPSYFSVNLLESHKALYGDEYLSTINPTLLTYDYPSYFAACEPTTCSYNTRGTPTAIAGLATAMGVLSGAQALIMMLLDRGLDIVCRSRFKAPVLALFKKRDGDSAPGDDEPAPDGGEGGAGAGGGTHEMTTTRVRNPLNAAPATTAAAAAPPPRPA